eukprot:scaffold4826_cov274-Chaetoceros_neogracile.AAC.37
MPETAQYRINIEKIANYRINAATSFPDDPEKVEELCNCGQVEELVEQADNEMIVTEMYLRNRWWEIVREADIDYQPAEKEGGEHGDIDEDQRTLLVKDIEVLNATILERLDNLNSAKVDNSVYIANTRKVAGQRLTIVQNAIPQLDKNPNKIGNVEKRIIDEMNFAESLEELVQQARDELTKIDDKMKGK